MRTAFRRSSREGTCECWGVCACHMDPDEQKGNQRTSKRAVFNCRSSPTRDYLLWAGLAATGGKSKEQLSSTAGVALFTGEPTIGHGSRYVMDVMATRA